MMVFDPRIVDVRVHPRPLFFHLFPTHPSPFRSPVTPPARPLSPPPIPPPHTRSISKSSLRLEGSQFLSVGGCMQLVVQAILFWNSAAWL